MRKFKGRVRSAIVIAAIGASAALSSIPNKAYAAESSRVKARSFTVKNSIKRHHHNSFRRVNIKSIIKNK